jgi:hypothetical protein
MELRKFFLRLMLWSLGAAAVVGVLAMLFFRQEIMWRVVGTAAATAAASGLMLAMSILADKEHGRWAGVLGMAGVIAEFLLGLALIWDFGHFFFSGYFDREFAFGLSMFNIAVTVLPGMACLVLLHKPNARVAAAVGLGLCAIILVILMIPTWFDRRILHGEDYWQTAAVLGGIGIVAVGCLVGFGTDRRHWRWAGILAALVATVMSLTHIWLHTTGPSWPLISILSLAIVVAHADLVLLCPLAPGQFWVRNTTLVAAPLTAVLLDIMSYHDFRGDDLLGRLAGASGIVTACGTLALGVFARINRRIDFKPILREVREVTLFCPGCSKKQTLPAGDAQCPTCGLRIHTSFEEPRCPKCDYLLYMLTSDRCPECGEPIRAAAILS